ncbi:MAG: hypothetical protein EBR10_01975 [Planctomycetes bacterium]|nr:hypothetical protein [Planctomycetota bacterium]
MLAIVMATIERDTAVFVLESLSGSKARLSVPRSNYEIELLMEGATADLEVGKRVRGVVHARALRMHQAAAGGTFIEPVQGAPRIVQGRVLATDTQSNCVLLHAGVPMWVRVPQGQAAADFVTGELLNFYVESGAALRRSAADAT